jgi:PAS domain S-box-containing protein
LIQDNIAYNFAFARDISERKMLEETMRKSEETFRALAEQSFVGITIVRADGIMYANNAMSRLLGYSIEEILSWKQSDFINIIHPDDREQSAKYFIQLMNKEIETLPSYDFRLITKKGSVKWILMSLKIFPADLQPSFMGSCIDITDRKLIEDALRRSEETFRALAEQSQIGIMIIQNQEVLYANDALTDITGFNLGEILRWKTEDLNSVKIFTENGSPPSYFSEFIENNNTPYEQDISILSRSGSIKWVTVKLHRLLLDEKSAIMVLIIDITERKKIEGIVMNIARGVSAETGTGFFKSLVSYIGTALSADMVFISEIGVMNPEKAMTLSVYKDGKIIDNREYNLAGTPCETVIKNGIFTVSDSLFRDYPNSPFINDKSLKSFVGSSIIDSTGLCMAVVAVLYRKPMQKTDITESVLRIFAIRAAAELERIRAEEQILGSLREKEVLLKEIHHRVKNNMQVIISLLSLQSLHIFDKRDRELFVDCQNRVFSMALVHEKLYQSENLSAIDFHEYLNELVSEVKRAYQLNKPITLNIDSNVVFLDIERAIPCGLIVSELVTNAMKYAFSDYHDGIITVALASNNDHYILSVKDNGKGIPDGFDFHKSESLGFMLVNALVQQLRGTIERENTKGTSFVIRF